MSSEPCRKCKVCCGCKFHLNPVEPTVVALSPCDSLTYMHETWYPARVVEQMIGAALAGAKLN